MIQKKGSKQKHIVLGVTGSIAAYKSADIIRRLQDKGFDVSVIMTNEAERFITPLTLESLSGHKVHRKMFDDKNSAWTMGHINIGQNADILLIAPATANTISKIACGIADDLLLCTVLATKAKIMIAPAMNVEMYKNKIIQDHCTKLKKCGMKFIEPIKGKLACGTFGEGHLAEVEDIVQEVVRCVK